MFAPSAWALFSGFLLVLANNDGSDSGSGSGLPEKYGPGLRMNQIQVIGTHNSYHQMVNFTEFSWHTLLQQPHPENLYYSHASLPSQLGYQSVRGLELDLWADPDGGRFARPLIRRLSGLELPSDPAMNSSGTKVLHVPDADVRSSCYTLVECLTQIRDWSKANPDHVPLTIMVEFKNGNPLEYVGGTPTLPWNDTGRLDELDAEFRSVFSDDEMINPDDIRYGDLTLEQSVLQQGWPTLDWARGKVMFMMDDGPKGLGDVRNAYIAGRPNLEGRVVFSQSVPGEPDCAFQKLNTPTSNWTSFIQEQVSKNYWVRTRADIPITTVLEGDTQMRDAAFESGAQMISTDYPVMGMASWFATDYVVRFPGGRPARCNPVTAADGCGIDDFEPNYYP